MANKRAQFDVFGFLIFLLAGIIASVLFSKMIDPGKGGAIIRAKEASLGNTIDLINLLDMGSEQDLADLIVEAHLSGDWTEVESGLSNTLDKIYSGEKAWKLYIGILPVASRGAVVSAKSIIDGEVWLPLPYRPDRKMIKVELIVS
jgi:hypothetical protein